MATETKRLQVWLPVDLHKAFQIACLKRDENMTDVVTQFINKYVELSNKKETLK